MSAPSITLYGMALSGHTHRVALLLSLLGLPHRFIETPPPAWREADFLALNPLGQIPVLVDGDLVLADSNAILVYLALTYDPARRWLPTDPIAAAQVQRWLSIAAGEVRFGPAAARVIQLFGFPGDLAAAQRVAERLLPFVEAHLTGRAFLAADAATLADLACYAYIAHAPEGGVSLEPYPQLRAWLARVEALPGFTPMPRSPTPA